ncbi:hypothetical protein VNO78_23180 [Psophocarpus tetragonolobus]|uniref:Uncharacterized protein n=1 Tax=Psophocarpus tetragonolobus TaxID=3891 RepID=A0AAN9XE80_PSOTE
MDFRMTWKFFGSLRVDIDPAEQDDVSQYLLDKFKCVPTFLHADVLAKFYDGFCKRKLWLLSHYMLPFSTDKSHRFDRTLWEAYVLANKLFFQKDKREVIACHPIYLKEQVVSCVTPFEAFVFLFTVPSITQLFPNALSHSFIS